VEAHAHVEECILMNDVVVGAGAHLRRCSVDKQIVIAPGARVGWDLASDRKKFTVTESGIVVIPKGVPQTQEFWRA
jgi:glucose-1-phosphate adenylyltransferase